MAETLGQIWEVGRLTSGPSLAMWTRRGDSVHDGELGEVLDGRKGSRGADLHGDDSDNRFGAQRGLTPASLVQKKARVS
jgi:hypothetical protein